MRPARARISVLTWLLLAAWHGPLVAEPTTGPPSSARPPVAEPPDEEGEGEAPAEPREDEATAEPPDEQSTDDNDPDADRPSKKESKKKSARKSTTEAKKKEPAEPKPDSDVSQVEIHIPSVQALVDAAKRSKTAQLADALSGMIVVPEKETDEGFDVEALWAVAQQVVSWPDTSLSLTTFTQDREGRPRWALRVDWPLDDLRARVQALIDDEKCRKLLKEVRLAQSDDGFYAVKLPDFDLAVLRADGKGSMLTSNPELRVPEEVFGRKAGGTRRTTSTLLYCRLNLEGGAGGGSSLLNQLSGVRDIKYAGALAASGGWSEKFGLSWNPLIGLAIKAALQKVSTPFACPRSAYVVAALNLGAVDDLADGIAGLPAKTIGDRAGSEFAVCVTPGTGFLPLPDVFFQFHARGKDKIIEAVRAAVTKENERRKADDRRPAWHEETVDDITMFWRDPAADGGSFLTPATFRTVVFFEHREDNARPDLIIASTSTAPADAVRRWRELTAAGTLTVPRGEDAHWQARIRWRTIYRLLQPYLSLLAGFAEGAELPPGESELKDVLVDARLDVSINYNGFLLKHEGPIPLGAAYVPAVAAMSFGATDDPSSESERERVACRHLRVLHHHAKLFKKDYGRWPATVAELDGYVDFASHPSLLRLHAADHGVLANLAAGLFRTPPRPEPRSHDGGVDDALYEIEWSERDWKLKIREGELKNYRTIYIDAEGEIHRVAKSEKVVAKQQ